MTPADARFLLSPDHNFALLRDDRERLATEINRMVGPDRCRRREELARAYGVTGRTALRYARLARSYGHRCPCPCCLTTVHDGNLRCRFCRSNHAD